MNESSSPDSAESPHGKALPPKNSNTEQKTSHPFRWIIGLVVGGLALFVGLNYLVENWARESTDDAFIDGHVAAIASRVPGEIVASHVVENQNVKVGDLLVELDPRDAEVHVSQKRAALQSSQASQRAFEAGFDLMRARVTTAEATGKQTEAEAEAARATFENAEANWNRASNMWAGTQFRAISEQDFSTAKTTMIAAKASWQADLQKAASDASKVIEARAQLTTAEKLYEQAGAQVIQSQADVKAVELDLSYTKVVAPVDGRVTRKMVEKGTYVQAGQNLLAIVRPEIWVTANFKETQTAKIRPGQPVRIEIDGATNRFMRGHVDSIQSGSGARFSLLPPENAVGNYVKVVQRVPVKIAFDDSLSAMQGFGPGMSVSPSVEIGKRPMSKFAVAVIAFAVMCAAGMLIWMIQNRRTRNPNGRTERV